jgi:type I restriction enzyme R subunit
MIATGTDVKPLECVFFMRDVRSAQYFEQMKGRGARTIPPADFQAVTPDATAKTRFVIVDAVGVTEHDFVEPPLNRDKSVSLKKLLDKAAALTLTEDETATLASRLAKLELELTDPERAELDAVAGRPVREVIRSLVDAVDPETQTTHVVANPAVEPAATIQALLDAAVEPIAANPALRNRILELRATHDRTIDEVSRDTLVDAHGVVDTGRAKSVVASWRAYLDEHRNEITAIQFLGEARDSKPGHRVSFNDIQELADRIARPPYSWTPDFIWDAYVAIEAPNVRRNPMHTLTDLVSLVRYTVGADDELVPYADIVRERYASWLVQQEQAGVTFAETERWWLDRMVSVIASSAGISASDLDDVPFTERGGTDGALRDLGDRAAELIEELNAELTA